MYSTNRTFGAKRGKVTEDCEGMHQWLTQEFFSGGGSTNSVEDGDLGTVAP